MAVTFYACDLRTGRSLGRLQLSSFQAARHLNGHGQMQATVRYDTIRTDGELDWARISEAHFATSAGRSSIVMDIDGVCAGEWVLTKKLRPVMGEVQLIGSEMVSLLDSEPMPKLIYAEPGTDQSTIARTLAKYGFWAGTTSSGTAGAMSVAIPDGALSGVRRVRRYDAYDGSVGQRLAELADVIDGFEYTVSSSWTSVGGVRYVARTFQVHYPKAGRDTAFRLQAGLNVTGLSVLHDGSTLATKTVVACSGEGDSKIIGTAADATLIGQGYPARTLMRSALSVNQQSTANAKAQTLLNAAQTPERPPALEILADGEPRLTDLSLGDRVWVIGRRTPNFPQGYSGLARIVGWSMNLVKEGPQTVQLEIEPGGLEAQQ